MFIKNFTFEPVYLREQKVLVELGDIKRLVDVELVYIAICIANQYHSKEPIESIVIQILDHVKDKSHDRINQIKPDISTLASCGILLQNHVYTLYQKRGRLLQAADQSAKVVQGWYVELNTKEQGESIISACDSSGRIDVEDIFVEAAGAKAKVRFFTAYEFDLPFSQWNKELCDSVSKIPIKSCSPLFFLPKPKEKFLLFCITKKFDQIYYRGNSETQKIRNYYELFLHEEESRFKQGRRLTYLDPEQGFATAILMDGKKIVFTLEDFKKFRFFFCRKFERSPEQWALFFKRAILQWFICYSLGLLDSIDMQSIYSKCDFYRLAQNMLDNKQKQSISSGILFKVDRFTFNCDKVTTKVIRYLNNLVQNGISVSKILEELEKATKYSGTRISKNITINIDKAADLNGAEKLRDDILPGDFIFNRKQYTAAESAIKQYNDDRDEFTICFVKERMRCPEIIDSIIKPI